MKKKKINVTQPSFPPLEEFVPYLKKIWDSKWLTNNGPFHQQLEQELAEFLGVKYICLFNNATIALMVAMKALKITGEVITTPFSFVATSHSIVWNNTKPIFCDIDSKTYNIDPSKIEKLITPETSAILPVHVYGNPCINAEIQAIANKYKLKLIYDAAHAFNVRKNYESILNWGDLSVLSFHATKVFNTLEGGAIICHSEETKQKIDDLKNFGFRSETEVVATGINGKMNELQAAFGLLQIKYVEDNIQKRKEISDLYRLKLTNMRGITCFEICDNIKQNYSYFPILIDKDLYGLSRDELFEFLKENGIYARKYFYPLISNFIVYKDFASSHPDKLPIANFVAEQVLCLPIYSTLDKNCVKQIIKLIMRVN
jgi:dTDP-4-amino-4,6-dideoxy-D-glucose transaminase